MTALHNRARNIQLRKKRRPGRNQLGKGMGGIENVKQICFFGEYVLLWSAGEPKIPIIW